MTWIWMPSQTSAEYISSKLLWNFKQTFSWGDVSAIGVVSIFSIESCFQYSATWGIRGYKHSCEWSEVWYCGMNLPILSFSLFLDCWTFNFSPMLEQNSLSSEITLLHQLPSPPTLCNSLTPNPTPLCSWQLENTLIYDSFESDSLASRL